MSHDPDYEPPLTAQEIYNELQGALIEYDKALTHLDQLESIMEALREQLDERP